MERWVQLGMLVAVVALVAAGVATIRRVDGDRTNLIDPLRDRFYLGVPWGTLVVVAFVCCVYLFVQGGGADWDDPVVLPFRAWSYQYPLGMLTAGFAHASESHLLGNLTGALVVAPIAEFAWGHYPRTEGAKPIPRMPTDPRLRAFVVFPLIVVAVGLLTSLFAIGPVIGFSGVVFAFAGFAIVHYPIATIVATLGAHGALATTIRAIRWPQITVEATASPPAPPSWATIAIQGHALGFLLGLLLGIGLLRHRTRRPDPLRFAVAVTLYAFAQSMWAIYWFGSGRRYHLLRGPGVLAVLALSIVVVLAVFASERPLVPWPGSPDDSSPGDPAPQSIDDSSMPTVDGSIHRGGGRSPRGDTETDRDRAESRRRPTAASVDTAPREPPSDASIQRTDDGTGEPTGAETAADDDHASAARGQSTSSLRATLLSVTNLDRLSRRGAALLAVLLVLAAISGPAVFVNAFAYDDAPSEPTISIEDYHLTYDESVENQLVSVAPVEALGLDGNVTASGVIVWSDERHVWTDAISAERLAFTGRGTVEVGGLGWRETAVAERRGWSVIGNETVYQVHLSSDDAPPTLAFESEAVRSDTRIAGYGFELASTDGTFELRATRENETVAAAAIPDEDETVPLDSLSVTREADRLVVAHDDSRVVLATVETYR
ncbi:rhomboid family intramembrane serine protease [Halovivax limisalsi]|uniref:rhomboid family intramembrane serine protease n=1 Tax=Halovivax limisalsi TaxID=1453760 RepID=UPI001FFD5100|nr:rhomboid family intramembrane serine protease [Halovivax limisalsi]